MFQKRSLTTSFLVASLGLGAGFAVFSSAHVASADDCNYKHSEVNDVCKKGGKKAVESTMKEAVKEANKAGGKLKCGDCHGEKNAVKPNAQGDFDSKLKTYFDKAAAGGK
jgi:hypothetical protein